MGKTPVHWPGKSIKQRCTLSIYFSNQKCWTFNSCLRDDSSLINLGHHGTPQNKGSVFYILTVHQPQRPNTQRLHQTVNGLVLIWSKCPSRGCNTSYPAQVEKWFSDPQQLQTHGITTEFGRHIFFFSYNATPATWRRTQVLVFFVYVLIPYGCTVMYCV